jgi:DNA-binding response OmpR family regulator
MDTAANPPDSASAPGPSILIVDDEPIVVEVVARYLAREGYAVLTAADGHEALEKALAYRPALVVLDVMLPGIDGIEVCRRLRAETQSSIATVPIILLTARGEEADRIAGLRTGADDYVAKPFSPGELVARVRAQLRRVQMDTQPATPADGLLRGGDVALDPAARTVEVRGEHVSLTPKEFDLLHYLIAHAGQAFSRDALLDAVWDRDFFGFPSTVTVHMRRLREKIERDPDRPAHLKTVWGVGYKFDPLSPI